MIFGLLGNQPEADEACKIIADYTWNNYTYNRTTNTKLLMNMELTGVLLGVYPWTTPARVTEENFNDRYQAINAYAQYENTFGSII